MKILNVYRERFFVKMVSKTIKVEKNRVIDNKTFIVSPALPGKSYLIIKKTRNSCW